MPWPSSIESAIMPFAIELEDSQIKAAAHQLKLEECEEVISRGLKTFNEVGEALLSIRDCRLYRPGFSTFEDYCRERWDLKERQAYRLMDAAKVMFNLQSCPIGQLLPVLSATCVESEMSPIGDIQETSPIGEVLLPPVMPVQLPVTESQVRPLVSLEPEEQREAWQIVQAKAGEKRITAAEVQAAVDQIARDKQRETAKVLKTEQRQATQEMLIAQNPQSLPVSVYAVIEADPPWRYDFSRSDSRLVENQYPTLSVEEICALPVEEIATRDCVLFLWATSPKLPEAMRVMVAWGFEYKTCMVWVKDKIGMGYYARQRHEILLIGTRGNLPVPEPAHRPDSVIEAPRGKHSAKPDESYSVIERMYPGLPKVELFSRQPRNGWSAWGNQCITSESA